MSLLKKNTNDTNTMSKSQEKKERKETDPKRCKVLKLSSTEHKYVHMFKVIKN